MKKNFVLDTNVLLHDPRSMFGFDDNDVVIPIYVIEEIDNFKRDLSTLGRNARQVSRYLDDFRAQGKLGEGVLIGENKGRIFVLMTDRKLPFGAGDGRTTDVVARYGGEEFAVVMPETDAAGAAVIAERIRERVKALRFDTGSGQLQVTLSLGIAAVPDDADAKAKLIERADACLYHAKRNGRDRSVSASSLRAAPPARLGRAAAAATSPEPATP